MASADISPSPSLGSSSAASAVLRSRLDVLTRRRNAQQMARHIARAAMPAVALSAIGVALYRFHIIPDGPAWAPAALIGASIIWGARNGWMARRGHFAAARDADKTLKLDDRLSSALAFVAPDQIRRTHKIAAPTGKLARVRGALLPRAVSSNAVASPATNLVPALVGDASARAASLDPRAVYPFRFDRSAQLLTLCAALLVGAYCLPDAPILMNARQKTERAAIIKEGEKLIAVSKQIRKEQKPDEVEVAKLNNKLEKLGQKMARGRLTKRAALTEIGELKKKLEDVQKPGAQAQSGGLPQIPEALKQTPLQSEVGRRVKQAIQDNKMEDAAKELDKLADRLDKGQVSAKEKEQVASDLDKVAKDLENRGGAANQDAAQKLKDAANQLRQAPQTPPQNQAPQPQSGQPNGQSQPNPGAQNQQQGQQKQGQQNQQQNQQGQQQQNQQNGQGQQNQSKQGQGQQGGQQQQKQGQQGQQGAQQQGGQQQGKQGQQQQGGQGQSPQQQGKQGQQSQGSQGQSPQGQGKQGQQGGQGQGQNPQGQNKQGQQGGQGGQTGQGEQGQGNGASGAMRDMANSLRQGSGNGGSGNMREMLDKLRQAENGASGQGNMSGQPGGGNSAGGKTFGSEGEMGKMVTPGKDLKATDPHGLTGGGPGLGPRNNSQGVNSGGGVSDKKSARTGDKRRYADAWANQLPATQKNLSKIKGKWGGGGEVEQLPTKGEAKGGQASTPLYDTYQSYKKDAEDAVSRETVPPAYKQPVKDYFESIKP